MVFYKTKEQIEQMRESALLVAKTHTEVAKAIKPGLATEALDALAETLIRDHGAEPAFKGYNGFPWTLCISRNQEVVHGMPSKTPIREGDVLSIDCGVNLNGYYGDSAYTFLVGEAEEDIVSLLAATKASLYRAIDVAVAGNRLGDIGFAVQQYTEKEHGFGVVRDLVGHGIGKALHEDPQVPNYGKRGRGMKLQEGLVLAIEPMVNLGTKEVEQLQDGWTIVTADGKVSAHYEHTVAVGKSAADILSSFESIESAELANPELTPIETPLTLNG
jgi:methionyl aminopeptidase